MLYKDITDIIKAGNGLSKEFPISKDLRQGYNTIKHLTSATNTDRYIEIWTFQ